MKENSYFSFSCFIPWIFCQMLVILYYIYVGSLDKVSYAEVIHTTPSMVDEISVTVKTWYQYNYIGCRWYVCRKWILLKVYTCVWCTAKCSHQNRQNICLAYFSDDVTGKCVQFGSKKKIIKEMCMYVAKHLRVVIIEMDLPFSYESNFQNIIVWQFHLVTWMCIVLLTYEIWLVVKLLSCCRSANKGDACGLQLRWPAQSEL